MATGFELANESPPVPNRKPRTLITVLSLMAVKANHHQLVFINNTKILFDLPSA